MSSTSSEKKQYFDSEEALQYDEENQKVIVNHEGSYSFDKGFYMAVRAIQLLRSKLDAPVVILGIAGPSGSGKTSMANKIQSVVDCTTISLDNYFDGSKVIDDNFDDPNNFDWELLVEHLQAIKKGEPIDVPVYSYKVSRRVDYVKTEFPNGVAIVEGIYCLHANIRKFLDLKMSIVGGVHFDLIKRVMRDIQRTGQTPKESIAQMADTVFPMYKTFIEPDLMLAEIKITNKFDPLASLHNPLFILKTSQEVDQETVKSILPEGEYKYKSETYFDIYLYAPNSTNLESGKDWIRIRQNGSRFIIYFCEWLQEGDFIISPRLDFEVSVKTLGGLMALGYQIGATMTRVSNIYKHAGLTYSFDTIPDLDETWLQIKGLDRSEVQGAAEHLGISEFTHKSYIELAVHDNKLRAKPVVDDEQTAKLLGASMSRSGLKDSNPSPLTKILARASVNADGPEEFALEEDDAEEGEGSNNNTLITQQLDTPVSKKLGPQSLLNLMEEPSVGMSSVYDTQLSASSSDLDLKNLNLDAPATMRDIMALTEALAQERQHRIHIQRELYTMQQKFRQIGDIMKKI